MKTTCWWTYLLVVWAAFFSTCCWAQESLDCIQPESWYATLFIPDHVWTMDLVALDPQQARMTLECRVAVVTCLGSEARYSETQCQLRSDHADQLEQKWIPSILERKWVATENGLLEHGLYQESLEPDDGKDADERVDDDYFIMLTEPKETERRYRHGPSGAKLVTRGPCSSLEFESFHGKSPICTNDVWCYTRQFYSTYTHDHDALCFHKKRGLVAAYEKNVVTWGNHHTERKAITR